MPCASFSMLDGPGGIGCDIPVMVVGIAEMLVWLLCLIGGCLCFYISYCSVVFSLGPFGSICKISRFVPLYDVC